MKLHYHKWFIVHCSLQYIITPIMLKTLAASPKVLSVGGTVSVGDSYQWAHTAMGAAS